MSSTTEKPEIILNGTKHEKRGDRWYICFGGGLEVSDAQNDLLDIAYEQSQNAAPVCEKCNGKGKVLIQPFDNPVSHWETCECQAAPVTATHALDMLDREFKKLPRDIDPVVEEKPEGIEAKAEQAEPSAEPETPWAVNQTELTIENAPVPSDAQIRFEAEAAEEPALLDTLIAAGASVTPPAPQVISVPLLFPVMPIPQTVTEVHEATAVPSDYLTADDLDECMAIRTRDMDKAINQPGSEKGKCVRCGETLTPERMILCLDCTAENRHYETPAEPTTEEIANDVVELLAQAMATVSEQAKKLEEQQAEINRLTCAATQRETEVASAVTDLEKQTKIATQACTQVKSLKAENKEYKTANEMLTGLNADLQATVFSIAGAFGLLPANVTVANIIDAVRKMPNVAEAPKTEAPKTLPFVQD